ncbi:hypothetical protein WJX82_002864 [Trebouxia sp. C0006]
MTLVDLSNCAAVRMVSSSASGSKLAELEEKLKGLEEQKAAELKQEKGTRDLELLVELNKDLDRVQAAIIALSSGHLQTVVVDKTARKYEPAEDEISLAGIVDMLLWHIWSCPWQGGVPSPVLSKHFDQRPQTSVELKKSIRCILHALKRPLHTSGTYQKGAARAVHSTMVKKL